MVKGLGYYAFESYSKMNLMTWSNCYAYYRWMSITSFS